MKYLEKFEMYTGDRIEIFELNYSNLFDLLIESQEKLIFCPCDKTKAWATKSKKAYNWNNIGTKHYKYCCHNADKAHFKNRMAAELYNQNNFYIYESPEEPISQKKVIKIEIDTTYHWFERLYRKSDPKYSNNPKIFNPDLDEAIDKIIFNIDKIVEKIKKFKKTKFYLELIREHSKTNSGEIVPYSTVFAVETINYDFYKLTLITHIKGERLYSKNYDTTKISENLISQGFGLEEILEMINY